MKKTFPLHAPGKADERVVEAIKHDVRKYVKRERGKTLPEGFDQWDFVCKVGASSAVAEAKELKEVAAAIDKIVQTGADVVYVEINSVAGHRAPRPSTLPATSAPIVAPPTEPLQSS